MNIIKKTIAAVTAALTVSAVGLCVFASEAGRIFDSQESANFSFENGTNCTVYLDPNYGIATNISGSTRLLSISVAAYDQQMTLKPNPSTNTQSTANTKNVSTNTPSATYPLGLYCYKATASIYNGNAYSSGVQESIYTFLY